MPESQCSDALNAFDSHKKITEYLDILDYKLGTGHLCHNYYYIL
jgi:hypothetical protein